MHRESSGPSPWISTEKRWNGWTKSALSPPVPSCTLKLRPSKGRFQSHHRPSGQPGRDPRRGHLEVDGFVRMSKALSDNIARLYEFRLDEAHSRDAGPICGGLTRLFANPRGRANAEHYREAIEAMERRERGRLVTALSRDTQSMGQAKWIAVQNRAAKVLHGCREEDIERCLRAAMPLLLETESGGQTLFEPLVPRPRLPIVGGGHVGQTVAPHIEPKPLSCK